MLRVKPGAILRILVTNNTLAERAGTELYVRDLALALLKRGHTPIAYSNRLGEVADELRAATVPVIDDLNALAAAPDIIHGQHHLQTMTALLQFPGVPAIYFCHGWTPWEERPPRFPRILRYLAVDEPCRDRLLLEERIPEDQIKVLLNFVDLERFQPRGPLPARPARALVFGNSVTEESPIAAIREACTRAGIQVDVFGSAVGKPCAQPERVMGNYDLVFAKARAALEALAIGTAVILCDARGAGPMVTTRNLDRLRPMNFGRRALSDPISVNGLSRAINCYEPADAAEVSRRIRATAGLEPVVDSLVSLYREVIEENQKRVHDLAVEERAASSYLVEMAARSNEAARAMGALNLQEAQLEMIKNSRSWRLMNRYAALKQKLLLPVYSTLKLPSWRHRNGDD